MIYDNCVVYNSVLSWLAVLVGVTMDLRPETSENNILKKVQNHGGIL